MDGDDFYVDLFGIQWESEGENTVLFPDKEADMLEGNTNVSADAEEGDVSFCRSEGRSEEDDKSNCCHDQAELRKQEVEQDFCACFLSSEIV